MYEYKVLSIPRVIDGDTFDFDLDLGFYASLRVRIRLADIDTYEIYGKNAHPSGQVAKSVADQWMRTRLDDDSLYVRTMKGNPENPVPDGSFGRWMGVVYDSTTNTLLADYLKAQGFEK